MLTGFSKEELAQMAKECDAKFEGRIQELFEQAADYQIKTYDEMKKKLESLQLQYEDEMSDYKDVGFLDDKTDFIIEMMMKQEDNESLQVYARDWLDALNCVKQATRPHWENENGDICDEYGRPLASDGEHSIGEIIKGGKFKE